MIYIPETFQECEGLFCEQCHFYDEKTVICFEIDKFEDDIL